MTFHRSVSSRLSRLVATLVLICAPPCSLSLAAEESSVPSASAVEAEVQKLLSQMSLEEKLLQLLSFQPNGVPRLGIPNLRAGEALHGVVSDDCTSFPASIALGATFDPELVRDVAVVIAREARAVGMHQSFSPMLGVARDPRWGRVEETYGEDPLLVTRMGIASIEGMQGVGKDRFGPEKIITTPKHFVADGEPWAGANGEGFETSDRVLREVHFPPFEAAVKVARTGSIMPAHHSIHGVPCHANSWLLQTVLRDEWGFDGFVTSDMGDIPKLGTGGGYGGYRMVLGDQESAVAALNAGVDMELIGKHYMKDLPEAIAKGQVSMATVDRSVARVLRLKQALLGFGKASVAGTNDAAAVGGTEAAIRNYQGKDDIWAKLIADGSFSTPESQRRPDWQQIVTRKDHDALALKAAERAVVLLKNQNRLLPLDPRKHRRVLVVGPLADTVNLGGYSTGKPKFFSKLPDALGKLAGGSLQVRFEKGCADLPHQKWGSKHSTPQEIAALAAQQKTLLEQALRTASEVDVIVAMVGHSRGQLGENLDRDTFELPGGQQALVEAMHGTGKPVVVVQTGGNIFSTNWIHEHIPAVLQAFYLGQDTGTALARVLYGEVNPGAKMPMTTPRNVGQSPWYYNHPPLTGPINYYGARNGGGPLLPFGHGLSYTTFAVEGLKADASFTRARPAELSVTVRNTGDRAGDEVVQFYIRQDHTSLVRPVMELKGFQRVHLAPGESRKLTFQLGEADIRFWKHDRWVTEPGTIQLMVGVSAGDIRQRATTEYR